MSKKDLLMKLNKIRNSIINLYFILLKKIIPCKIITIEFLNPLNLKDKLYGTILASTKTSHFTIDDILDSVFKFTKRMLKEKDIHDLAGLEIVTPEGRYQIFYLGSGYSKETNPARDNNEDFKNLNNYTRGEE